MFTKSTKPLWDIQQAMSEVATNIGESKGAFRLDAKQPKFDVINSSRKVATGRNLREQLRNIACLQAVVRWPTKSLIGFLWSQFARKSCK